MVSTIQTQPIPRLSPEQIAGYQRDGFVIVRGLYSGEEMLAWKKLLQEVLEEEKKAAGDQWNLASSGVRVWNSQHIHPTLLKSMADNHVTPILQQIIGPNVEFLSGKVVFKNDTTSFASPWHHDWFYWGGSNKISVWIAMDDANPANGCLKLIPGSYKKFFAKMVSNENAFSNRIADADVEGLPVVAGEVKRGDAVFFHDLTVHSSYPNTAKKDRWSFISTYRDAGAIDGCDDGVKGLWEKPKLVCGKSINNAVPL